VLVLIALWAVTPIARATLLLRDSQHPMGPAPNIAGVQTTEAHFYTTSDDTSSSYSTGDDNPVPIAGWMALAHPQAPTVILLPGWKDDRRSMLAYAAFLIRGGLNVLLIDLRGSGHSGGSFSLGLYEPTDVKAAVSYLDTLNGLTNHHYGVFGVSFGAGVAIATAGGNGKQFAGEAQLNAIVADSPWATEDPTVDRLNSLSLLGLSIPLPHSVHLFGHTVSFLPGAQWTVDHTVGGSPDTRSALSGAAHLQPNQALLIIHSVHDTDPTTSYADTQQLYQAATSRHKFLWLAPLGGHAGAYDAQPEVYASRVLSFFRHYLVSLKDAPTATGSSPSFPMHYSGH
jgi:alpha/beta superfamily hydrolase